MPRLPTIPGFGAVMDAQTEGELEQDVRTYKRNAREEQLQDATPLERAAANKTGAPMTAPIARRRAAKLEGERFTPDMRLLAFAMAHTMHLENPKLNSTTPEYASGIRDLQLAVQETGIRDAEWRHELRSRMRDERFAHETNTNAYKQHMRNQRSGTSHTLARSGRTTHQDAFDDLIAARRAAIQNRTPAAIAGARLASTNRLFRGDLVFSEGMPFHLPDRQAFFNSALQTANLLYAPSDLAAGRNRLLEHTRRTPMVLHVDPPQPGDNLAVFPALPTGPALLPQWQPPPGWDDQEGEGGGA